MKTKTAYIVDDERLARIGLRNKLSDFPEIKIVGEGKNIKESITGITNLNPEILFLDIQLKDGTGFDILNKIDFSGKVIFVTAFDEYAIRAFEINALDYLLKPISKERLQIALERIKEDKKEYNYIAEHKLKYNDRIMISKKKAIHFIKVSSIVLISAAQNYSEILTIDNHKYLTPKSLQDWEDHLPLEMFCRIHRSHIVNFEYIKKSEKSSSNTALIYLKSMEEPLKLSRSYFKKVKDKYM